MKKIYNTTTTGLFVLGILFSTLLTRAQVPTYRCELKNDTLLTDQVYEFDIFLRNDDAVTFELGNFQAGIIVNPSVINGGTISVLIIPGSSELNAAQQPSAAMFSSGEYCLKLAPKTPPDFSQGTVIPGTGPGTRVCRLRLTNTVPFGTATPDLSFNFTVFPYNTVVSAFDRATHLNVNITGPGSHFTSGLTNPMLNGPIAVYAVSGSGSYCEGSPGTTVVLGNSQAGLRYQLKKNGANDGEEVPGTGTALAWANRTAGTYTVSARRPATYQAADMDGSAVITMDDPSAGGSVTGGTTITIGAATDTLRLDGALGMVVKWQKQLDGGGYVDIPSTFGLTAYQEIPASAGTWEYRAVVQNATCPEDASSPASVVVSAVPVSRSWTGLADEKWNRSGNWSPSGVPGTEDDVIIPATAPFMPVVKVHGFSCNNINVQAGASLVIEPGFVLTVNGSITLED